MPQTVFKIDRKTASRLLKVSVRTVDRYIRAKKLQIEQRDGRIWLSKSQLSRLQGRAGSGHEADMADRQNEAEKQVSTPVDMSIDSVHSVSTPQERNTAQERIITAHTNEESVPMKIYKKLFEELQIELKAKQERLEGANYRVGQLEGILKESVPLPEHNRLLLAERAEKQRLEAEYTSLSRLSAQLQERLKDEKFTRKVFLAFIFILMLLQPLWLVLSLQK